MAPSPIPPTDLGVPEAAFRCSNSASLSFAFEIFGSPTASMVVDVPTLTRKAAAELLHAHCPADHPPPGTLVADGRDPPTIVATSVALRSPHASNAAADWPGAALVGCPVEAVGVPAAGDTGPIPGDPVGPGGGRQPPIATSEATKTARMNRLSPEAPSPAIERKVDHEVERLERRGRRVTDRRY